MLPYFSVMNCSVPLMSWECVLGQAVSCVHINAWLSDSDDQVSLVDERKLAFSSVGFACLLAESESLGSYMSPQ